MKTNPGLLAAICAAPDDDAPRLVYADWLLEQGDPRGELILVQCRLAQSANPDLRAELEARVTALTGTYGAEWYAAVRATKPRNFRLRRGFIQDVVAAPEDFLAAATQLFDAEPVQSLHLEGRLEGLGARLAEAPWLARLTELKIHAHLGDDGAAALAQSVRAGGLRSLNLASNRIGPEGAVALAASRSFQPESLTLTQNPIGLLGLASLCELSLLAKVSALYLSECGLTGDAMTVLAASEHVRGLKTLALNRNSVGDEGVRALASSPHLHALTHLELDQCGLTEACVPALLKMTNLRRLSLRRNKAFDRSSQKLLVERFGPSARW